MWRAVAFLLLLTGCGSEPADETPQAASIPLEVSAGGQRWNDPYAYLADADHQETIRYRTAEQDYFDREMKALASLQARFVAELNAALPLERRTRAVRSGDYMYYAEVSSGTQYPVYHRYPLNSPDAVEVMLDVNQLAGGSEYFALGSFAVQNETGLIAYTTDQQGSQSYQLNIAEVGGADLPVQVDSVGSDIGWLEEDLVFSKDRCFFVLINNGDPFELMCSDDPAAYLSIQKFGDEVVLLESSPTTMRSYVIGADFSVRELASSEAGHQYQLYRHSGAWFALTNHRMPEFELATFEPGIHPDDWQTVELPGQGQLADVELIGESIVVHRRLKLRDSLYLDSGELIAESGAGESLQLRRSGTADVVEYLRSSVVQPDRYYAYDLNSGVTQLVDQESSAQTIDASEYVVEQRQYLSDEVMVPVTVFYKKGGEVADRPLLVSVYGSYGITLEREFDSTRLPLLERGVVFAMAHVRGGGALGPNWHVAGKGKLKPNTFNDFINVTEGLVRDGIGRPDRVAAFGSSAGGTVVAAAANQRSDLFKTIIARVPFVDVIGSLQDEELLLTPSDWLEWGNPANPEELNVMMGYSPYNNVRRQTYSDIFVSVSVNDVRVPYHESLKWMASLREHHEGNASLLLQINENEGHSGATDQYNRRQSQGLEYAFLAKSLNLQTQQ